LLQGWGRCWMAGRRPCGCDVGGWRPLWPRGRHGGWSGGSRCCGQRLCLGPPVLASVEVPSLWRLAASAELFSVSWSTVMVRLGSSTPRGAGGGRGARGAPWSGCGGCGGLCAAVAPLLHMRYVCGLRADSVFWPSSRCSAA
jgi:hypothetical protein